MVTPPGRFGRALAVRRPTASAETCGGEAGGSLENAETIPLDYRDAGLRLPSVRGGLRPIAAGQGSPPRGLLEAIAATITPLTAAVQRSTYVGLVVYCAVTGLPDRRR